MTGHYIARWSEGHPPEDIFEWLNGAGVNPQSRFLHQYRDRGQPKVDVIFDNENDAFMCWMAFSDDLERKPWKARS